MELSKSGETVSLITFLKVDFLNTVRYSANSSERFLSPLHTLSSSYTVFGGSVGTVGFLTTTFLTGFGADFEEGDGRSAGDTSSTGGDLGLAEEEESGILSGVFSLPADNNDLSGLFIFVDRATIPVLSRAGGSVAFVTEAAAAIFSFSSFNNFVKMEWTLVRSALASLFAGSAARIVFRSSKAVIKLFLSPRPFLAIARRNRAFKFGRRVLLSITKLESFSALI
mmetsp:Transcript_12299/g.18635  ORF Transcript_12299/g.18635 Transcript_12299/m.18635 type:complete len:225 (+) Transcript_12299:320-994(+)